MRLVLIALLPACGMGIYQLGWPALRTILISVAACVGTEALYEVVNHKRVTISDFSAIITGLILAMCLSAHVVWWIPLIGGIFAILIVKQFFGGLGQNIINPAMGAKCFLLVFFANQTTIPPGNEETVLSPILQFLGVGDSVEVLNILFGKVGDTIGTTSLIALIVGVVLLIWFEVINLYISGAYLLSLLIFVLLHSGSELYWYQSSLDQIFSGSVILAVFFMANDYVTSPVTRKGHLIYGIVLGVLTGVFCVLGDKPDAIAYAIILSNLLVPIIDKITRPVVFGK